MLHQTCAMFVALVCILHLAGAYNVSQTEISALQDLFDSTAGHNWAWNYPLSQYGQKWDFTVEPVDPCSNWQGVSCRISEDNSTGIITHLELDSYNLNGTIPSSISGLQNITILNLEENYVNGSLPESLTSLASMTQLRLSYNYITGQIPHGFYLASSNLSYLALTENLISGPLPDMDSGHSFHLREFFLNDNRLTGTIPDNIYKFSSLLVFFVGMNNLKGSIPESFYQMSQLQRLAINTNSLTGTISPAISQLADLRYTYWHENHFHGTIPESFGQLKKLLYITLFENFLTGSIPRSICNMTDLKAVAADTNYFSGSLPTELGDAPQLQQLNVYNNHITGPIPRSFANLRYLNLLLLQENHLTGNPSESFNRTLQLHLESVDLSSNLLEGPIPSQVFGPALLSFAAFKTCFSGAIPDAICDSTYLQSLLLDGATSACSWRIWPNIDGSPEVTEFLPGGIPRCIWTMQNLSMLHLSSNGLTGTIPYQSSYGNLTDLDLSFNLLSGEVPATLLGWSKLNNLNLKNNRFCGDITGASSLHYAYHNGESGTILTLSQNRFSGIIPLEIESALSIDIVEGNMFSCTFQHLPPYNDPNGPTYVCGSNLLYVSMASLAGALGVVCLVWAAGFWIAYNCVVQYELDGKRDSPFRVVYERMILVYHQLPRTKTLYDKMRGGVMTRVQRVRALVVVLISWKAQVDTLVRNEDAKHEKITYLGRILKESLLSNQDPEAPGGISALQGANLSALKSANIPHLVQFLKSLRLLRNVSLLVFLAQVAFTLPAYPILKFYRGTFLYQYGWYMSGAFLTGYEPPVVITVIWMVSLTIVLHMIVRYIPSRKALTYRVALQNRAYELITLWVKLENSGSHDTSDIIGLATAQVPIEIEAESDSYTMFHMFGALSRQTTINREDSTRESIQMTSITTTTGAARQGPHTHNTPDRGERHSVDAMNTSTSSNGNNSASSTSSGSAKKKTLFGYMMSYFRESVGVSIAAVLLDIIVVLSIKGAFVYALNLSSTTFGLKIAIELCLSLVDLIWSVMFVPFIITRLPMMKTGGKMILKIALLYFNSIAAPCIAIVFTERSCFNGLFIRHSPVKEVFTFSYCALFSPYDLDKCIATASWATAINYTPPFLYNYDCYSNVVTSYTPIFIFSYCILTVGLPIASMYITTLTKRKWFRGVLPAIFWLEAPTTADSIIKANAGAETEETGEGEEEEEEIEEPSSTLSTLHKVSSRLSMLSFKTLSPSSSRTNLASGSQTSTDNSATVAVVDISTGAGAPRKRRRRSKPKAFLFFPGFILASAIHHILVLLTFGLMLPVLGLAIVLVVWITSITWELLLGRYLSLSPHCNPTRWQDTDTAEATNTSNSVDAAAASKSAKTSKLATDREEEEDCSGGLDRLCIEVCCCPRKCKLLIAFGSAAVFVFATLDMAADKHGSVEAIWAPVMVLLLPVVLIACLKYSRIGTLDEQTYLNTLAQQSTTETMILMRNTVVNDEVHNVLSDK